jgi:hypothetical protein
VNRCIAALFAFSALALVYALPARAGEEESKRAQDAVRVLKEVMMAPDKRVPSDLINSAYAIAVIPDVIKAGFVIGGRHGLGIISVKGSDGTWSNPSFISMTGGSIGFQAGVSAPTHPSRPDRSGARLRRRPMPSSRPRSTRIRARVACSPARRWTVP